MLYCICLFTNQNKYEKNLYPLFVAVLTISAISQSEPLWLRYSAISPAGKTILFNYKGDIYSVASVGGAAVPLTYTMKPSGEPQKIKITIANDDRTPVAQNVDVNEKFTEVTLSPKSIF